MTPDYSERIQQLEGICRKLSKMTQTPRDDDHRAIAAEALKGEELCQSLFSEALARVVEARA